MNWLDQEQKMFLLGISMLVMDNGYTLIQIHLFRMYGPAVEEGVNGMDGTEAQGVKLKKLGQSELSFLLLEDLDYIMAIVGILAKLQFIWMEFLKILHLLILIVQLYSIFKQGMNLEFLMKVQILLFYLIL